MKPRMRKFFKDMGIYAIGNIGSKVITFLMVPLYTYFVEETADFGYYDICLQVCFLLLPFVTLQLRDGGFRFLLDCEDVLQRKRIVTFVVRTLATTFVVTLALALLVGLVRDVPYLWWTVALLLSMSLQEVLSQVMRGLGNNRAFVTIGIVSAFGIGFFSLVFVAWMGMGIKGIFLANIVARLLAVGAVEARTRLLTSNFRLFIKIGDVGKEILRYCLPLLPGALCWWLTGSSDRFFIMKYLGLEANGVYAVAIRFTSVIQTIAIIFYQAWQETAILQYNSPDRDRFFSRMFTGYVFFLGALFVAYAFLLKLNYGWLVADQYEGSLRYIYPLGVAAVIFALSAFFDMGYQCAKDTARTLPAIVASAIINVALNFALVPLLGMPGVVLTLILTYLVLFVWRWHDMKRYFRLRLPRQVVVVPLVLCIGAGVFYANLGWWADLLGMLALLALLAFFSRKLNLAQILHGKKKTS